MWIARLPRASTRPLRRLPVQRFQDYTLAIYEIDLSTNFPERSGLSLDDADLDRAWQGGHDLRALDDWLRHQTAFDVPRVHPEHISAPHRRNAFNVCVTE